MNRTVIWVLFIATAIIVLAWFFSSVFFYIVFSVILATALRPMVNTISRFEIAGWPVPRFMAITTAYAVFAMLLTAFVLLFVPLITDQIDLLANVELEQAMQSWMEPVRQVEQFLIKRGLTNQPAGSLEQGLQTALVNYGASLDFSMMFGEIIAFTGSFFIGFMAIAFITTFLLLEQGILRKGFIEMVPNKYFEVFINALHKIEKLLSNYLLGLILQMITIFALASLGLSLLRVEYALTIAVFAAVANVVPYLGPVIGSAFGILVAMLPGAVRGFTQDNLTLAIEITAVFVVVQMIDNWLVQPVIFSKSVKAHPLEIFVIIFVGATIAGIPGMIAAIPVYTIVRVSVSEMYSGLRRYRAFKIRTNP